MPCFMEEEEVPFVVRDKDSISLGRSQKLATIGGPLFAKISGTEHVMTLETQIHSGIQRNVMIQIEARHG